MMLEKCLIECFESDSSESEEVYSAKEVLSWTKSHLVNDQCDQDVWEICMT